MNRQQGNELTQEQREAIALISRQLPSVQEETYVKEYARSEWGDSAISVVWMTEGVWQIGLSVPTQSGYNYVLYKVSRDGEDFRVTRLK